jgi:hypothetical protein
MIAKLISEFDIANVKDLDAIRNGLKDLMCGKKNLNRGQKVKYEIDLIFLF